MGREKGYSLLVYSIVSVDILERDGNRMVAVGCQNGYLRLSVTPGVSSPRKKSCTMIL